MLVVLLYLNEKLGCFGALVLSTTSHHAGVYFYLFFAFRHYRFALYRQLGELGEESLRWALNSATLRSRRPVSMPAYCDTRCSRPVESEEIRSTPVLHGLGDEQ